MSVARAAEVRARAEHLKKQRDLLVAKRKKEREEGFIGTGQLDPNGQLPAPAARPAPAALPPQSELKRGAGFSSGSDENVPPSDADGRAMLTRSLASNMKASLLGEDAQSLELQQRIETHQRKADFENTKAQLMAEMDAAKDSGF